MHGRTSDESGRLAARTPRWLLLGQDEPPPQPPPPPEQPQPAKLTPEQLQELVAPIALYPDALVAQILAASAYPTQIVEADRFLQQNPNLKGAALGAEVNKQDWDPSVKALTQFPSVLSNMDKDLSWTSELGDANYNQPQDVMDAIQFMRQKAEQAGNLKSTPQQTVTNQGSRSIIQPANPQVVYVPEYDPDLVYGYPVPLWPGFYPWWGVSGPFISFGIGFGIGPFFGFGWGWPAWGCHWGFGGGLFFGGGRYAFHSHAFYDRNAYFHGNFRGRCTFYSRRSRLRGYAPREGAPPPPQDSRSLLLRPHVRSRARSFAPPCDPVASAPLAALPVVVTHEAFHTRPIQHGWRYARRRLPWWRHARRWHASPWRPPLIPRRLVTAVTQGRKSLRPCRSMSRLYKGGDQTRCFCEKRHFGIPPRGGIAKFAAFAILVAGTACFPVSRRRSTDRPKDLSVRGRGMKALVAALQRITSGLAAAFSARRKRDYLLRRPRRRQNNRAEFVQKISANAPPGRSEPDGTTTLYIGAENWPTPIPLVHKGSAWYFDTAAGKQEILYRRIGRNELAVIQVCRELVDAEKEYYAEPHDGDSGRQAVRAEIPQRSQQAQRPLLGAGFRRSRESHRPARGVGRG